MPRLTKMNSIRLSESELACVIKCNSQRTVMDIRRRTYYDRYTKLDPNANDPLDPTTLDPISVAYK